jgi:hypothetical protein
MHSKHDSREQPQDFFGSQQNLQSRYIIYGSLF